MEAREIVSQKEYFWPIFWRFLHIATLAKEEEVFLDTMEDLLWIVHRLIPCYECQEHFWEMLRENPYTEEWYVKWASRYIHHLHNVVNKKLGKKVISYDEFIQSIENE